MDEVFLCLLLCLFFLFPGCSRNPVLSPAQAARVETARATAITTSTAAPMETITPKVSAITSTPGLLATALYIPSAGNGCQKPTDMPGYPYPSFNPFCIFWHDTVDNEEGFILVLEYADYENIYDRFIFRTGANATVLSIPEEFSPRLQESQVQCRQRKSFALDIYALVAGKEKFISGMAWESECNLVELPTATPEG